MRVFMTCILMITVCSSAHAEVNARARRADANTPLELADPCVPHKYRNIMTGTKLTITIDSNVAEEDKMMSLYIEDDDRDYGMLFGKGPEPDYPDSVLEAAGTGASVEFWEYYWEDEGKDVRGFDLYTGYNDVNTGNWFIFDYNAVEMGDCNVAFYWWDYGSTPDHGLIYELEFTHVRTRDFDLDHKVNLVDYSILAAYWQDVNCSDPNWCEGSDLNTDGSVDANDLTLFIGFWLEQTQ